MNPTEWEDTILKIVEESDRQTREMDKHKVLLSWRTKLEQEPTRLPPYKIDWIVREVRRRLQSKL